jgi:multiple sugar transport system permease protein
VTTGAGHAGDRRVGWIVLAPFLVGVAALLLLPAAADLAYAFTDHPGIGTPRFNGLTNLRRMVADPLFWTSLRASLLFALMAVPLRLLIAGGLGIALARPRPHARWQRVLVYLPTVLPDITLSLAFLYLFNPLYGPINGLLGALGLPQPVWLATPWGARWAIVTMMLFPIGEAFLVVMAARRELPHELFEAAAVDGASPWQRLIHITLPSLAPLLTLLLVRDTILSLQVNFVPTYLLTDGAPANATLFVPVYVYDLAFEFLQFGYGAAVTLVLLAVTTALVVLQLVLTRRWFFPRRPAAVTSRRTPGRRG